MQKYAKKVIPLQPTDPMTTFGIHILEQLNESNNLMAPVTKIIEEIRAYFEFGCGFVYVADHKGVFSLGEHSAAYGSEHLQLEVDLKATIGAQAAYELAQQKVVLYPTNAAESPLEKALGTLFEANSMILIPIKDQTDQLIALVGLVDRRGGHRHKAANMDLAYALLAMVANHVKLRLYQVRIQSTRKSLESVLDHMGVDIYVNDFNTHEILYVNQSMAAPYGGIENMMGKTCWKILYDDKTEPCEYCPQKKIIDEKGDPTKIYSWDYQRPFDGSWFRVLSAAFRWVDGRLAHVVSSVDITENKQNEALIRQLAEYDALTELPNRRKLMQDCERQISTGKTGYVLFFDLDGFKKINDEIGHRAGDELLYEIGRFLESNPLLKGRSYRHGGDEFVTLAFGASEVEVALMIEALLTRFGQPWHITDGQVSCKTSIGIASFPSDAQNGSDLIHKADMAMYKAKNAGAGQACYYDGAPSPG